MDYQYIADRIAQLDAEAVQAVKRTREATRTAQAGERAALLGACAALGHCYRPPRMSFAIGQASRQCVVCDAEEEGEHT